MIITYENGFWKDCLFTAIFQAIYNRCYLNFVQWSFGVTCWEIFTTAKTPYPGIHPTSLIAQLENGERLPKPYNASCSDAMYVITKTLI